MAVTANLVMEDAAIQLLIGTAYAGTVWSGGSGADCTGIAKELRLESEVKTANVQGSGSPTELNRFYGKKTTLTIKTLVPAAGMNSWNITNAEMITGYWVQVKLKELSSLAAFKTFIGVVEKATYSTVQGEPQFDELVINLNPAT